MIRFTVVLLAVVGIGAEVQPEAKPHPILAEVRAAVPDAAKPFTLVVRIKVKEGVGKQFEAAFAKAAKESRKEKGNRAYDLSRFTKTPNEYMIYERWENVAALEAHLNTTHFKEVMAATKDMAAGPAEIQIHVPVGD